MSFDRAVMGADGVWADRGICEADLEQARLKELMMSRADHVYVLAHGSKLSQGPFDARGYYCKYPHLTRLRDRGVLVDGVLSTLTSLTWELEGFALADSYDEATGRYAGLVLPGGDAHFAQVSDGTLLVAPSAAMTQSAPESETDQDDESSDAVPGILRSPKPGDKVAPATAQNTRFFGVYKVDPERYARDLARVSQEVLQQLAAVDGSRLEVTIEVHAHAPEGFPDDKVRVVLENTRTLKFEQSAFEDE